MNGVTRLLLMGVMGSGGSGLLPGFEYTVLDYADYVTSLSAAGCTVTDLGACSDDSHVYSLSYGNPALPAIAITGTIHGGLERGNAYIIKRFMEYLVSPPGGFGSVFASLLDSFYFVAIPCCNPAGYTLNQYCNANDVNINRNFDHAWAAYDDSSDACAEGKGASAASELETQIVQALITTLQPVGHVDMHIGGPGASLQKRPGDEAFWLGVCERMLLVRSDLDYQPDNPLVPQSAQWSRGILSSIDRYPMSATFEVGGLETVYERARVNINFILAYCLELQEFYNAGWATTWTIQPDAAAGLDTTIAAAPINNYNYGINNQISAGKSSNIIRRALIKIDLNSVPAGTYTSATLTLTCTGGDGAEARSLSLHRLLADWSEGSQTGAVVEGDGATWDYRNANGAVAWGAAGAQSGVDYVATASVTVSVSATGTYEFDVTADIQAWLSGTANYGWIVINNAEATNTTRKLFASSDYATAASRPQISIALELA